MKALNTKTKTIFVLTLLLFTPCMIFKEASSISVACKNSPECLQAIEREQEATTKAKEAQAAANEYQAKVNQLDADIASMSAEIAESEAYAKDLQQQIEENESKLKDQQAGLASLLVEMHFNSDSDIVTILAGSKTLSEYTEKKTRNETIKNQIAISAQNIIKVKEQLEIDKAKVETIIESQKAMREAIAAYQAEQAELVRKYSNDASSYAADAEAARQAQQTAMEAYAKDHPELFGGAVYFGANTYSWQADCPSRADTYGTAINGNYIGGYVCECVSYAGWKAWEEYGLYLAWGNANTWDDVGRAKGIVDHTPAAKVIGQFDAGYYGHVFWVESVNADGSINISEYNNAYSTQSYTGIYQWHDFGSRVVDAATAKTYNYIHIDRLV